MKNRMYDATASEGADLEGREEKESGTGMRIASPRRESGDHDVNTHAQVSHEKAPDAGRGMPAFWAWPGLGTPRLRYLRGRGSVGEVVLALFA